METTHPLVSCDRKYNTDLASEPKVSLAESFGLPLVFFRPCCGYKSYMHLPHFPIHAYRFLNEVEYDQ
jgi:hypothetical protein